MKKVNARKPNEGRPRVPYICSKGSATLPPLPATNNQTIKRSPLAATPSPRRQLQEVSVQGRLQHCLQSNNNRDDGVGVAGERPSTSSLQEDKIRKRKFSECQSRNNSSEMRGRECFCGHGQHSQSSSRCTLDRVN